MANAETQKKWREKTGKQRVEVYLSTEVVEAIDAVVAQDSLSQSFRGRGEAIEYLVRKALKIK